MLVYIHSGALSSFPYLLSSYLTVLFSLIRLTPRSTLFPYTTLFRSWRTNYKISDDGLNWNANDEGTRLAYGGAPYVAVMHNGDIVANTDGSDDFYINRQNGKADAWEDVKTYIPLAYSRSITVLPNDDLQIGRASCRERV